MDEAVVRQHAEEHVKSVERADLAAATTRSRWEEHGGRPLIVSGEAVG